MPFLIPLAVGTAATTGGAAATAGLVGTAGALSLGTTLATAGVAASIAGTVFAVGAEREAGKTAKQVAEQNAANLKVQADQERLVVKEEQKRLGEEKERRVSRLRILAANAGIDLVGTPLLQAETIAGEFEEERQFIGQAGRQRRFGLEFRAGQQRLRGRAARRTSRFRVGSTLLTGAASLLN